MQRFRRVGVVALATFAVALLGNVALGQSDRGGTITSRITQTWTIRKGTPDYSQTLAYLRAHADRGSVRYGLNALLPSNLGDAFHIQYTRVHHGPGEVSPLSVPAPFPPPFIPTKPAGPGNIFIVSSCNSASRTMQIWTWKIVSHDIGGYEWDLIDYNSYYVPSCTVRSKPPAPTH